MHVHVSVSFPHAWSTLTSSLLLTFEFLPYLNHEHGKGTNNHAVIQSFFAAKHSWQVQQEVFNFTRLKTSEK